VPANSISADTVIKIHAINFTMPDCFHLSIPSVPAFTCF
jgi:hypothetical protein